MPASTPRTRLIFQNLNCFVGPAVQSGNTATGQMYTLSSWGQTVSSGNNLIAQLEHVTSATMTVGIARTDINIFGLLQRIDQILINPPTINLNVDYYASDGYNENMIGFNTNGNSILSGILTKVTDSKNYFISISQQGIDDDSFITPANRDCYAVGNGFISNYTFNAAVGQVATASFTVDGLNVAAYAGSSGLQTPAVYPANSNRITGWYFSLPSGAAFPAGNSITALRPGDVQLSFPTQAGFIVPLSGQSQVNVQSVSISLPISRDIINRLGSPFGFSREIRFPVDATLQVRALQTEINANSLDQLVCNDQFYNFGINLFQPGCNQTGSVALIFGFNQAKLVNISHGFSIGGEATVDLSFSAQLAGASSTNGITLSGIYSTS